MFKERVKTCRKSINKTQKEVAEFLGITDRAYQHYESGARFPDFHGIIKLCNYFNVSADYLLGLSDDPTRH